MEKKENIFLYALIGLCAIFWGVSFLFTSFLFKEGIEIFELLAVRWTIALVFFLILWATRIIKLDFKNKPILLLLITGMLQPCLYSIFEAAGIKLTTASESSIIIATIPLFVLITGIVVFKKSTDILTVFAIFLALVGVVTCVIFLPDFSIGGKIRGYGMLFTAVLLAAFFSHSSGKCAEKFTPMESTFAMTALAAAFFNILNLATRGSFELYSAMFSNFKLFGYSIVLGIGCSAGCYIIFNYAVSKMVPAKASNMVSNSTNVVGVLAGIIFAGDNFGWYTAVGLACTITGICLTTRARKKEAALHEGLDSNVNQNI